MSARKILATIGFSACLLASAVAFFIVAYTTFFGVAVIGLAICYVSTQFQLDADTPVASSLTTSFLAAQIQAQHDLTVEQRIAARHEQSLTNQSARFFKFFGFGLAVIGLSGGVYYQL